MGKVVCCNYLGLLYEDAKHEDKESLLPLYIAVLS